MVETIKWNSLFYKLCIGFIIPNQELSMTLPTPWSLTMRKLDGSNEQKCDNEENTKT